LELEKTAKYRMVISRNTIDKLGIQLYDKPSAALVEIIANAYDADARHVAVKVPLNKTLASRSQDGKVTDLGYTISVKDDGHGMTSQEVNDFYLRVGINRRQDKQRGAKSPKGRNVTGRKGIGKLAPFGICKRIEVKTAGGTRTAKGYQISDFVMDYGKILSETDEPYPPDLGDDDGKFTEESGTEIILSSFLHKRTPDAETFHRQISRKFSLGVPDFEVEVEDSVTSESFKLGELEVETNPNTKIDLDGRTFTTEGGETLRVRGWVAYSKYPYKNEEVAGVRIYANGKLAATTKDFGIKAGFHGEHTVRSYLLGVIHADWIDEEEDLNRTDRQDILWDSERGAAFQKWGQDLLRELGKIALKPMREKSWQVFLEKSNLESEAMTRFKDPELRASVMQVAKGLGSVASLDYLEDEEHVESLKQLVFTVAPHKVLVEKLQQAAEADEPIEVISRLFNDAKLAETASLGQIALERVGAVKRLQDKVKEPTTVEERVFQELIEKATWLLDPRWTALQANQAFSSLSSAYNAWYLKTYKKRIQTSTIDSNTRPDFIMLHVGKRIEIVELKKPDHTFNDDDFERLQDYVESMERFLKENREYMEDFDEVHATLIADRLRLSRTPQKAFASLETAGRLSRKTWLVILRETQKVHEDFLKALRSI
jgi:hypothetical protein